jgi:hypothetical protein
MSGMKSFTDNSSWYYSSPTSLAPKNTGLTSVVPSANDGEALGTSSVSWSDLFLASGGVLNWNNGDITLTHSADTLTFAGGVLALPDGTAANPSLTFSGDTNTGLFRTTTDTLGVATAGIQQTTVNADGTLRLLAADRTSTAAASPDWINVSGTYTLNSASGTFGHGYHFAATLVAQQSMSALGGGLLFRNTMTLKNATGVTANIAPFFSFAAQPTFNADGAALSQLFGADYISSPAFTTTGGGTLATASVLPYSQFWAQGITVGSGVTMTTRIGFSAGDATVSGTLTNNYGVRVDAQTGGTNDYGVAIGTASTNTLWIAETSNPTTEAGGIVFGSSRDTNLYRSAASTLKTDDSLIVVGRVQQSQGADVASANNLVLGSDGNTFEITGTTQVNLISNLTWQNGSKVTLLFTSTPTVKHAQATATTNITILLAGAVDFVATAGDTLTLVLSEIGGTQAWREISRAVI